MLDMTVKTLVAFVGFLLAASLLPAQESVLDDVAADVLDNSLGIQSVLIDEQIAMMDLEETIALAYPGLTLDLSPYSRTEGAIPGIGDNGQSAEGISQSFGLGLSLNQALPTGGVLSLSMENSTSLTGPRENPAQLVSQSPSLALNFLQPLFVGKELLEGRLLDAGLEIAEIGVRLARMEKHRVMNEEYLSALTQLGQWVQLIRQMELLEAQVEVAAQRLEQSRLSYERGLINSTQLYETEQDWEALNQSLLELQLAEFRTKQELQNTFGISVDELLSNRLEEQLLSWQLVYPTRETELEANFGLQAQILANQIQEETFLLEGREGAGNLNINTFVSPGYSLDAGDERDFAGSVDGLLDDEAVLNWGVSISFSMDLDLWGKEERRQESFQIRQGQSLREIDQFRTRLEALWGTYHNQLELYQEQLQNLSRQLDQAARELENQQTRFDLGQIDALTLRLFEIQEQGARTTYQTLLWETHLLVMEMRGFTGENILPQ